MFNLLKLETTTINSLLTQLRDAWAHNIKKLVHYNFINFKTNPKFLLLLTKVTYQVLKVSGYWCPQSNHAFSAMITNQLKICHDNDIIENPSNALTSLFGFFLASNLPQALNGPEKSPFQI
jgi:hypothetical protein